MPVRDNRFPAVVNSINKAKDEIFSVSTPLAQGVKQEISAFNNAGIWVPGKLRLNPVIISKETSTSSPAAMTPPQSIFAGPNGVLTGDVASHLLRSNPSCYNTLVIESKWDSTMASYSIAKAYSKMNSPDVDLGIVLVEARETLAGLVSPFKQLRDYNDRLNLARDRGKLPKLKDTLDTLSGSWLEWRYGVTPNIILVETIIKHLKDNNVLLSGKLSRDGGSVKVQKAMTLPSLGFNLGYFNTQGTALVRISKKTTTGLYSSLSEPLTWQERYGLDMSNLPNMFWEKVPLSFVLDWFLGVSIWLSSLKTSPKRTMAGSYTSQKTVIDIETETLKTKFGTLPTYDPQSRATVKLERLERRLNLTQPLIPAVNPAALSLRRQIDAVTLLWQRVPRVRR